MFLRSMVILALVLLIAAAGFGEPFTANQDRAKVAEINPSQPWAPTDEDSAIVTENFESGMGQWTTQDVSAAGFQWHMDDFNAYSGNSWWCGDSLLQGYDNHWLQYMVTPILDFSLATSPTLTFQMFYAVEDPAGATAPYDGWDGCNVWVSTDGGTNWNVIEPTTPAYNCRSLYSFGMEWGMGPNIPGWGGSSNGWVPATFDLSTYAGQSQVQLRFAFCSDPAYCTAQNPAITGFQVDSVHILDGTRTILYNDADSTFYPSQFTFDAGGAAGDFWTMSTTSSHSPTHSMWCDVATHYNLSNALVSPWIHIPQGFTSYFTFWLWCDMPDFDGDGNNSLEDYYHVEVTTDGALWSEMFYDYGDPAQRPGATGWAHYVDSLLFNGTMDLSQYAGQDIKLRWRVITDDNDDGGVGTGLWIDDVQIWVSSMLNDDVGMTGMNVPFPTSLSQDSVECYAHLRNFGRNNQGSVPAYARIDQTTLIPIIPFSAIPSNQSEIRSFYFTPTAVGIGDHDFYGYTGLTFDENTANDTAYAGLVTITPENSYELGYDARQYTIQNVYYFSFNVGSGAMCRFVPGDHALPEGINVDHAKLLFYTPGICRVHLYDEGTHLTPGAEITNFDVTVNLYPAWTTVDFSNIPEMQNRTTDFWIWVEVLTQDQASIMGDDAFFGEGHYFRYDGLSATAVDNREYYIRVMCDGAGSPLTPPTNLAADLNAVNGQVTLTWEYEGGGTGQTDTLIYDNGTPSGSYRWPGNTMGTHMSPAGPCQLLSLLYLTTVNPVPDSTFNAEVYPWQGSAPGTNLLHTQNALALNNDWTVVDVSGANLTFTGDFVAGFGSLNESAHIGYDAAHNNGRSWDFSGGAWSAWTEAYFIRAVVMYTDGSIEVLSPVTDMPEALPVAASTGNGKISRDIKYLTDPPTDPFIEFRVYRDLAMVGTSSDTFYVDQLPSHGTYSYTVTAYYDEGESNPAGPVTVDWGVGVENRPSDVLPNVYEISSIRPNPFNPATTIEFAVPKAGLVKLTVHNVLGAEVAVLADQYLNSGRYTVSFDGTNLSSGIYFVELNAPGFKQMKKVVLMK